MHVQDCFKLTTGTRYNVRKLVAMPLGDWIDPSDAITQCPTQYSYLDWFRDGRYLGPDEMGTEPTFVPSTAEVLP